MKTKTTKNQKKTPATTRAGRSWKCGMCRHESPARFRSRCQSCGAVKGMGAPEPSGKKGRAAKGLTVKEFGKTPEAAANEATWAPVRGKKAPLKRTVAASKLTASRRTATTSAAAPLPEGRPALKADSKMAELVTLLRRPGGVTLEAAMEATGWLAHTTRAFMAATLPKRIGQKVASEKIDGKRTYSLPPVESGKGARA